MERGRAFFNLATTIGLLFVVAFYMGKDLTGASTDTDRILGAVYFVGLLIVARIGRTARS